MQGLYNIPSSSYYRLNTNTHPNPIDSNAVKPFTGGKGAKTRRNRSRRKRILRRQNRYGKSKRTGGKYRSRRNPSSKLGYINYAGKQIGHQSQRQRQHQRQRNQKQQQKGGTMLLPSDLNMIASSAESLLGHGVSTLRGTDYSSNPIPFADKVHSQSQNL